LNSKQKYEIVTIVVHYNEPGYCANIVRDLLKLKTAQNRIVVADNYSADVQYNQLLKLSEGFDIDIIRNTVNNGFGAGVNFGAAHARIYSPKFIHVINTDTQIINFDYLESLKNDLLKYNKTALVGPTVLKPDGTVQNTIMPLPTFANILNFKNKYAQLSIFSENIESITVEVINGVCFLINADDFYAVSGFDEDYFMYVEEQDLAYKLKKSGKSLRYVSVKSIIHFGASVSEKKIIDWRYIYTRRNLVLFLLKRKKFLQAMLVASMFSVSTIIKKYLKKYSSDYHLIKVVIPAFFQPKSFGK